MSKDEEYNSLLSAVSVSCLSPQTPGVISSGSNNHQSVYELLAQVLHLLKSCTRLSATTSKDNNSNIREGEQTLSDGNLYSNANMEILDALTNGKASILLSKSTQQLLLSIYLNLSLPKGPGYTVRNILGNMITALSNKNTNYSHKEAAITILGSLSSRRIHDCGSMMTEIIAMLMKYLKSNDNTTLKILALRSLRKIIAEGADRVKDCHVEVIKQCAKLCLDKSPSIRQATASVIEAVSCNSEGCSTVTTNVLLAACTKGLEDDDGEVQDAYAKAVAAVLFEQITAYAAMQSLQRASSNRGGSNTGDSSNNNGDGTNSNHATPNKGASPQKRPSGGSTAMSTRLKNLLSSQKKIIDEYDFRNVILSVIKQIYLSNSKVSTSPIYGNHPLRAGYIAALSYLLKLCVASSTHGSASDAGGAPSDILTQAEFEWLIPQIIGILNPRAAASTLATTTATKSTPTSPLPASGAKGPMGGQGEVDYYSDLSHDDMQYLRARVGHLIRFSITNNTSESGQKNLAMQLVHFCDAAAEGQFQKNTDKSTPSTPTPASSEGAEGDMPNTGEEDSNKHTVDDVTALEINLALGELAHLIATLGEGSIAIQEDAHKTASRYLSHSNFGVRASAAGVLSGLAAYIPGECCALMTKSLTIARVQVSELLGYTLGQLGLTTNTNSKLSNVGEGNVTTPIKEGADPAPLSPVQPLSKMQRMYIFHGHILVVSNLLKGEAQLPLGLPSQLVSEAFDFGLALLSEDVLSSAVSGNNLKNITCSLVRAGALVIGSCLSLGYDRNKSKLTDLLTIYDYILKVIVSSSNSASAAQHGQSGSSYRNNENGGTTRRHSADSSTMKGAMGGQKGAVGAGNKDTNSTGNNISVGDRAKQEEILYEVMYMEAALATLASLLWYCPEALLYQEHCLLLVTDGLELAFKVSKNRYQTRLRTHPRFRALHAVLLECFAWLPPGSYPNLSQHIYIEGLRVLRDGVAQGYECSLTGEYCSSISTHSLLSLANYSHAINIHTSSSSGTMSSYMMGSSSSTASKTTVGETSTANGGNSSQTNLNYTSGVGGSQVGYPEPGGEMVFILKLEEYCVCMGKKETEASLATFLKDQVVPSPISYLSPHLDTASCIHSTRQDWIRPLAPATHMDSRTIDAAISIVASTFTHQSYEHQDKTVQLCAQALEQFVKSPAASVSMFSTDDEKRKRERKSFTTCRNVVTLFATITRAFPVHFGMTLEQDLPWGNHVLTMLKQLLVHPSSEVTNTAAHAIAAFSVRITGSRIAEQVVGEICTLLGVGMSKDSSKDNMETYGGYMLCLATIFEATTNSDTCDDDVRLQVMAVVLDCLRKGDTSTTFRGHAFLSLATIMNGCVDFVLSSSHTRRSRANSEASRGSTTSIDNNINISAILTGEGDAYSAASIPGSVNEGAPDPAVTLDASIFMNTTDDMGVDDDEDDGSLSSSSSHYHRRDGNNPGSPRRRKRGRVVPLHEAPPEATELTHFFDRVLALLVYHTGSVMNYDDAEFMLGALVRCLNSTINASWHYCPLWTLGKIDLLMTLWNNIKVVVPASLIAQRELAQTMVIIGEGLLLHSDSMLPSLQDAVGCSNPEMTLQSSLSSPISHSASNGDGDTKQDGNTNGGSALNVGLGPLLRVLTALKLHYIGSGCYHTDEDGWEKESSGLVHQVSSPALPLAGLNLHCLPLSLEAIVPPSFALGADEDDEGGDPGGNDGTLAFAKRTYSHHDISILRTILSLLTKFTAIPALANLLMVLHIDTDLFNVLDVCYSQCSLAVKALLPGLDLRGSKTSSNAALAAFTNGGNHFLRHECIVCLKSILIGYATQDIDKRVMRTVMYMRVIALGLHKAGSEMMVDDGNEDNGGDDATNDGGNSSSSSAHTKSGDSHVTTPASSSTTPTAATSDAFDDFAAFDADFDAFGEAPDQGMSLPSTISGGTSTTGGTNGTGNVVESRETTCLMSYKRYIDYIKDGATLRALPLPTTRLGTKRMAVETCKELLTILAGYAGNSGTTTPGPPQGPHLSHRLAKSATSVVLQACPTRVPAPVDWIALLDSNSSHKGKASTPTNASTISLSTMNKSDALYQLRDALPLYAASVLPDLVNLACACANHTVGDRNVLSLQYSSIRLLAIIIDFFGTCDDDNDSNNSSHHGTNTSPIYSTASTLSDADAALRGGTRVLTQYSSQIVSALRPCLAITPIPSTQMSISRNDPGHDPAERRGSGSISLRLNGSNSHSDGVGNDNTSRLGAPVRGKYYPPLLDTAAAVVLSLIKYRVIEDGVAVKRLVRPLVSLIEVPREGDDGYLLYSTYHHHDYNSGSGDKKEQGRAFLPRAASQLDCNDLLSVLGHLTIAKVMARLYMLVHPTESDTPGSIDDKTQEPMGVDEFGYVRTEVRNVVKKLLISAHINPMSPEDNNINKANVDMDQKDEQKLQKVWDMCSQVWLAFSKDTARLCLSQDFDEYSNKGTNNNGDYSGDNAFLFDSNPFGSAEEGGDGGSVAPLDDPFAQLGGAGPDGGGLRDNRPGSDSRETASMETNHYLHILSLLYMMESGHSGSDGKNGWLASHRRRQVATHNYYHSYGAIGNLYSTSLAGPLPSALQGTSNGSYNDEAYTMDSTVSLLVLSLKHMAEEDQHALCEEGKGSGDDLLQFYNKMRIGQTHGTDTPSKDGHGERHDPFQPVQVLQSARCGRTTSGTTSSGRSTGGSGKGSHTNGDASLYTSNSLSLHSSLLYFHEQFYSSNHPYLGRSFDPAANNGPLPGVTTGLVYKENRESIQTQAILAMGGSSTSSKLFHTIRTATSLQSLGQYTILSASQANPGSDTPNMGGQVSSQGCSGKNAWPNGDEGLDPIRGGLTFGLLHRPYQLKGCYQQALPTLMTAASRWLSSRSKLYSSNELDGSGSKKEKGDKRGDDCLHDDGDGNVGNADHSSANPNPNPNPNPKPKPHDRKMKKIEGDKYALLAILSSMLEQQIGALLDPNPPLTLVCRQLPIVPLASQGNGAGVTSTGSLGEVLCIRLDGASTIQGVLSSLRGLMEIARVEQWLHDSNDDGNSENKGIDRSESKESGSSGGSDSTGNGNKDDNSKTRIFREALLMQWSNILNQLNHKLLPVVLDSYSNHIKTALSTHMLTSEGNPLVGASHSSNNSTREMLDIFTTLLLVLPKDHSVWVPTRIQTPIAHVESESKGENEEKSHEDGEALEDEGNDCDHDKAAAKTNGDGTEDDPFSALGPTPVDTPVTLGSLSLPMGGESDALGGKVDIQALLSTATPLPAGGGDDGSGDFDHDGDTNIVLDVEKEEESDIVGGDMTSQQLSPQVWKGTLLVLQCIYPALFTPSSTSSTYTVQSLYAALCEGDKQGEGVPSPGERLLSYQHHLSYILMVQAPLLHNLIAILEAQGGVTSQGRDENRYVCHILITLLSLVSSIDTLQGPEPLKEKQTTMVRRIIAALEKLSCTSTRCINNGNGENEDDEEKGRKGVCTLGLQAILDWRLILLSCPTPALRLSSTRAVDALLSILSPTHLAPPSSATTTTREGQGIMEMDMYSTALLLSSLLLSAHTDGEYIFAERIVCHLLNRCKSQLNTDVFTKILLQSAYPGLILLFSSNMGDSGDKGIQKDANQTIYHRLILAAVQILFLSFATVSSTQGEDEVHSSNKQSGMLNTLLGCICQYMEHCNTSRNATTVSQEIQEAKTATIAFIGKGIVQMARTYSDAFRTNIALLPETRRNMLQNLMKAILSQQQQQQNVVGNGAQGGSSGQENAQKMEKGGLKLGLSRFKK